MLKKKDDVLLKSNRQTYYDTIRKRKNRTKQNESANETHDEVEQAPALN